MLFINHEFILRHRAMSNILPAAKSNKTGKIICRTRSACDACHQSKIRCSGGNPCISCSVSDSPCNYSAISRLGRPKGSRNKRTLVNQASEGGHNNADSEVSEAYSNGRPLRTPGQSYSMKRQVHREDMPQPDDRHNAHSDSPIPTHTMSFDIDGITSDLLYPEWLSTIGIGGNDLTSNTEFHGPLVPEFHEVRCYFPRAISTLSFI